MLKKIWNGLSIISVVSWIVTLLCLLAIWILGTERSRFGGGSLFFFAIEFPSIMRNTNETLKGA